MVRHLFFAAIVAFSLASCSDSGRGSSHSSGSDVVFERVALLADDKLKGREAGTEGELMAAEYIETWFEEAGLKAAGTEGYKQPFSFFAGKTPFSSTKLIINEIDLRMEVDYFPLSYSGEGAGDAQLEYVGYAVQEGPHAASSYPTVELEADRAVALVDLSIPGGYNPHSDLAAQADLRLKLDRVKAAGAEAAVFFTRDLNMDIPTANYRRTVTLSDIPVFWLTDSGYARVFGDTEPSDMSCSWNIDWNINNRTGNNIIGKIDNGADQTVVIGGHYDHLGMGDFGSLHEGEPAIHNGADDNASGIAGMVELAHRLKDGPKSNNYLFIAFSAEEMGLFGSKHFVRSELFDSAGTNYMLNYDMIGRLDPNTHKVEVDGVASSPSFTVVDSLDTEEADLRGGGSGLGSSDHMSFYLAGIPSLHFFTGTHGDYHKPSDDLDSINVEGILAIVDRSYALIAELDDDGKLSYVESQSQDQPVPDFKVTLGVIPDYMFDGRGMRIESVREGRPAKNAGIANGDVVVRMGEWDVPDMMGYMNALSKFSRGQSTDVEVMRGEESMTFEVTF